VELRDRCCFAVTSGDELKEEKIAGSCNIQFQMHTDLKEKGLLVRPRYKCEDIKWILLVFVCAETVV
jgi:hypothetical protein